MVVLDALNDFESFLPDAPADGVEVGNYLSNLFLSLADFFTHMVQSLRDGLNAIFQFGKSISYLNDTIHTLANEHGLPVSSTGSEGVLVNAILSFDRFLGNIRFVVGDLVFMEIYALLLIGFGMFIFMLTTKLIDALRYVLGSLRQLPVVKDVKNNVLLKFINIFR